MDLCVICGKSAQHTHHRKRRSQGGTDEPANLMRVCLECHDWIHNNPAKAFAKGWLVHSWDDAATVKIKGTFESGAGMVSGENPERGVSPSAWLETPAPDSSAPLEPGSTCPTCKRRVRGPHSHSDEPRQRATWSVKVPKDSREDGAALIDERIARLRELLCPVMGWDPDVPGFHPLITGLDKGIEAIQEELAGVHGE